jgi:hypothetical protein
MNEVIAALVGLISSVVVSALSIYGAKKLGIGPSQGQLVTTLKDLSSAQDMRIEQLEDSVKEKDDRIKALEAKVKELEQTVIAQAAALSNARRGSLNV